MNKINQHEAFFFQELYQNSQDEDLKCILCYILTCYHHNKSLEPLALVASKMNRELQEVTTTQEPGITYRLCLLCHEKKRLDTEFPADHKLGERHNRICKQCLKEIDNEA